MNFIDNFLNKITMYRLGMYYLFGLIAIADILSFVGILHYNGLAIIAFWVVLMAACVGSAQIFGKLYKLPQNIESAYITAFILTLIVDPVLSWKGIGIAFVIGVLSMASKFIISYNNKHFFNPAAAAVFLSGMFLNQPASWWIGSKTMLIFVLIGGLLLVRKIRRFDLVLTFIAVFFITCISYNLAKGFGVYDTIYKAITHTPVFFFAFVMLTEPATSPSTRRKRIAYGALTGFLFTPQVSILGYFFSPESALLAGNIFSYIMSPTRKLVLKLKEKIEVAENTFDFVFGLDKPMKFSAGQYMEWTAEHTSDLRGVRRYFTIASAPEENELRIGIRFAENGSSFKKMLMEMPQGGEVTAAALAGDFTLPKNTAKKLVFIAGGIGITPFRSMLKSLIIKNEKRDIILLYSNRQPQHVAYKELLAEAETKLGIKTHYVMTDSSGILDAAYIKNAVPDLKERTFYISGPERLVQGMKQALKSLGVNSSSIKTDYFPGF